MINVKNYIYFASKFYACSSLTKVVNLTNNTIIFDENEKI